MADENAGSIYYEVDARTSGLLKAEREVDASTKRIEKRFQGAANDSDNLGKSMDRLRPVTRGVREETQRLNGSLGNLKQVAGIAAAALAAVGVTTGIGNAISTMANFEQAMLMLEVTSGATASQMKELEAQARTLGATSAFSAQQAGEAQQFLAQAGFEVNEIMSATPGILELATAAQIGLAQAADIASNVLGGMQMPVEELGRVNDTLAATAASANTNVTQLGQAFIDAGPIAAGLGISIEETAAAIGVMSDAGIQASRAGTGFRGVIRQLTNVTTEGQKVLEKYGLTAGDVSVETHGLAQVLDTVREAGIGSKDMFRLFGSEAQSAAAVLSEGSARVGELTGQLEDAEGAAAAAASKLGEGLVGSMRTLQSVMSESVLQLGDSGLAGALQGVIDTASGVIAELNGMGDVFADVNDLTDEQRDRLQTLANTIRAVSDAVKVLSAMLIGRLAASLGTTAASFITARTAAFTFNGALVAIRSTMMTLFGPVGIVAGAVTALGVLASRLDDAADDTKENRKKVEELTKAYEGMGEAALKAQIASLTVEIEKDRLAMERSAEASRKFSRSNGVLGDGIEATIEQIEASTEANKIDKEELQDKKNILEATKNALDNYRESVKESKDEQESETETKDRNTESTEKNKEATDKFADSLQSLMDKLFPLQAQQRQYREDLALLQEAMGRMPERTDEIAAAMERVGRSTMTVAEVYDIFNARTKTGLDEQKKGWGEWLAATEGNLFDFESMSVNVADNFINNFGGAFSDVLTQQKSFGDAMKSLVADLAESVISSIGSMIAEWLVYQAVTAAVGGGSGGGGVGGAIGSAFAGFFDKGGSIGRNEWGVVGETGKPEIVHGPAEVIGTSETAKMMGPSAGSMLQGAGATGRPGGNGGGTTVNVNLIESQERAGQTETRASENGEDSEVDVFVADIFADGPRAQAISEKWNLTPQGR